MSQENKYPQPTGNPTATSSSPPFAPPPSCVEELLANTRMSYFENLQQWRPDKTTSLLEIIDTIRSEKLGIIITELRRILEEQGELAYKAKKKEILPAISLSGVIDGPRQNCEHEKRISLSGLIQVDIDSKDNPGLSVGEMRDRCIATGACLSIFTSPSGKGVKALCRSVPLLSLHRASFNTAVELFESHGLHADKRIHDAGRLLLLSADPDLWLAKDLPPELVPHPDTDAKSSKASVGGETRTDTPSGNYDAAVIEEILSYIPPRPEYNRWRNITFAVYSVLGLEDGMRLLKEWSPEEKTGEYAKLYRSDYEGPRVGIATLIAMAKEHGYQPIIQIPENVIPVPGGTIGHHNSSNIIYKAMSTKGGIYFRGGKVVEVTDDLRGGFKICEVTPERFVEIVEGLGKRVARCEFVKDAKDSDAAKPGRKVWRTATMPISAAKVALQSQAAGRFLPPLRQVVNAPIIVDSGNGQSRILGHGYHSECGGTLVATNIELEYIPGGLITAVSLLRGILGDFQFVTDSDRSRAFASLISPALKAGGLINGDFPLDFAEADDSQSGKTYRQKIVAGLYNVIPSVITSRKGGVGGLDESVANALLSGGIIISMDNLRGAIDSPLLETALRGHGYAECRGFRASGRVDLTPFLWQLSTNGAEPTRDLANRSIIVRIKKQPSDFKFKTYPQGDLLAHISARRGLYLAAVFEIVREWIKRGKPRTDDTRHDFREWAQTLDWIIQNLCEMPPLLDGHREEQLRTSDSGCQWLRSVCLAAGSLDGVSVFTASSFADISTNAGIDLPGTPTREDPAARVGKILAGIFSRAGSNTISVGAFCVSRVKVPVKTDHGPKQQWQYRIVR